MLYNEHVILLAWLYLLKSVIYYDLKYHNLEHDLMSGL